MSYESLLVNGVRYHILSNKAFSVSIDGVEVANFELNGLSLPLKEPNSGQQVLAPMPSLVKCFMRFMNLGGKTNDWPRHNCSLSKKLQLDMKIAYET